MEPRNHGDAWQAHGIAWDVLDHYLAGAASSDDQRTVDQWLARDPRNDALLRALMDPAWRGTAARRRDVDARWQQWETQHRVAAQPVPARRSVPGLWWRGSARRVDGSPSGVGDRGRWGSRTAVASSLVIALLVVGGVALIRSHRSSPVTAVAREYATRTGQRAVVTLADGSRVTLAPQSKLHVGADFGDATRTVSLVGEAVFEVASATRAPFIVSTNGVNTRVLGTTFDVRRYPEDAAVRVAVVHGKVAVRSAHRPPRLAPLVLTAGTVGLVTDTTAVATAVGDNDEYTSWTRDELRFRETPVREMLDAVGRWYGYQFLLSDSTLAARHVTAQFILNEPAKTLAALKELLDVDMTFDGSRVLLRPRRTSARSTNRWKDHTPTLQRQEVGK